jgi:nitroreductase
MEFTELIHSRESIRNYDPEKPVPAGILEKILGAGRLAPSACNNQPWKFLLISSPEMLEKVRACYHREWFKHAPHILIVMGYRDQAWTRSFDGYNSIETDVAIAMTHIMLAAENEGVGGCWVANYNPEILNEAVNPDGKGIIFGITPLGYPKEGFIKKGDKQRKSPDEVIMFL